MNRSFVMFVVAAMIGGFIAGMVIHGVMTPAGAATATGWFDQVTNIFLRLIKMIIAPLVLTTLTSGIGHIESAATVGRIGTKAMIWFLTASFVALVIGLVMVNLLQPGVGAGVAHVAGNVTQAGVGPAQNFSGFLEHLIPASLFDAMARNEILQVVVFSIFAGIAISAVGQKAAQLLHVIEQGATVILKITTYVMMFAPGRPYFSVPSPRRAVLDPGHRHHRHLRQAGGRSLSVPGDTDRGHDRRGGDGAARPDGPAAQGDPLARTDRFFHVHLRGRFPAAFGVAGSDGFLGQDRELRPASGVYSFNLVGLDGLYCTFAAMFIAQAYGITVPVSQQILMLLILMVTSKGIAGVPRASRVVIAATLPYFNLPEQGLFLILAVDHLMDMGRSATNVIGNGLASAVVAKWENARPIPVGARPQAII